MLKRIHISVLVMLGLILSACGGSGGGADTSPQINDSVTLQGTIFFEDIPSVSANNAALDYNNIETKPARGVTVLALNSNGNTISTTRTDAAGNYRFSIATNTDVKIVAHAELDTDQVNIKVTDNTNNNRLYAIEGSLASSGTSNNTRNLTATSGWGGQSYTSARSAAPFHMLDIAYEMLTHINQTTLPNLEIRWSENNRSNSGDLAEGEIGTSFFVVTGGLHALYILGDENNDTDEYDDDVITHELTHYIEAAISRADSIGGDHSLNDALDMRVAYSEGLGNAVAAARNGDGFYVDSFGSGQQLNAVVLDLESSDVSLRGWFSEDSTQNIIYDVIDVASDGFDSVNISLPDFFDSIASDTFRNHPSLATIFLLEEQLSNDFPQHATSLDRLFTNMEIFGRGAWGEGETNGSSRPSLTLPVYAQLNTNSQTIACSSTAFGGGNKLASYRLIRLINGNQSSNYQLVVERDSGPIVTDPDIRVFQNNQIIARGVAATDNIESVNFALGAGDAIIELVDFLNTDNNPTTGGTSCFSISVQAR